MKNYSVLLVGALIVGGSLLQGCAPVAVFGGATTLGSSLSEERSMKAIVDDAATKAEINALWFDFDPAISEMVELSVREGRVLLTGSVDKPQRQIDAVRLAWKVNGVREVIDETKLGQGGGIGGYAGDTWVTTQLKAEFLFEPEILSVNYNIKTVKGTVYLIGIAQNQQELDRALELARRVGGVKEVVNYMRFKDNPDIMMANSQETVIPLHNQPTPTDVGAQAYSDVAQAPTSFPAPQAR